MAETDPNMNPPSAVLAQQPTGRLRRRYGAWAVVTGASDGIGREMASRLAAAGLDLVLVARREAALSSLAHELEARHGVATRVIAADLGDAAAVDSLAAATGALDVGIWVAAAGFGTSGPFIDSSEREEAGDGGRQLPRRGRALPSLRRALCPSPRGGIVLMSSLLAFQGVPRAAGYAATNAFVQSLAEGLHVELAPLGVDVVASAPGPIQSDSPPAPG